MPKKTGNAGHGLEAYDPKTGQYIKEGEESSKEDFSIDIIKGSKSSDLDDLFADDDEGEDLDSWLERRNFWNSSEKRDPNWVCDNIEKFFDKEVVDFLAKYDFHTASSRIFSFSFSKICIVSSLKPSFIFIKNISISSWIGR